ncbi:MAG: hypothetical protein ACOX4J_07750 [Anaerovoracaceae bacterium]
MTEPYTRQPLRRGEKACVYLLDEVAEHRLAFGKVINESRDTDRESA